MSKTMAAFFVVVILAFGWRCAGITFDSLWLDEGYQSIVDAYGRSLPDFTQVPERPFIFSPGSPVEPPVMLQNFRNVDPLTPPLYQLLLNRWIAIFGGSDLSVRFLSVFISTACVAAVFWVTNKALGLKTAFLIGLVQAFSPFDIYYGQEVRMYALVSLTVTLSCGTLFLLLLHYISGRGRPYAWALYVISTWALINSHYTGLFVVLFQGLLGLSFVLMTRSWRLLAILSACWIGVGILWLPWLNMFLQAAALRTASFYVARPPSLWWPPYALLVKIPLNWIIFLSGKQVVAPAIPIFVTSALSLLLCVRTLPTLERRQRLFLAMIALWAVVPAVGLWMVDVLENHKVIEIARYVMATAPAIYILAGVGFSQFRMQKRLLATIVLAYFFFASINNIAHVTVVHQREPWRELALILEKGVPSNQLVLVAQPYNIVCLDRYLGTAYRQVGVSTIMTAPQVESKLSGEAKFALITAQEGEAFTAIVPARFKMVEHVKLSHGLHLRRYEL